MEFTSQELELLFEAVEKWEKEDPSAAFAEAMIGSMMPKGIDPEALRKYEQERAEAKRKRDSETKMRRERGCLLRAKLIQIRDSKAADTILDGAR